MSTPFPSYLEFPHPLMREYWATTSTVRRLLPVVGEGWASKPSTTSLPLPVVGEGWGEGDSFSVPAGYGVRPPGPRSAFGKSFAPVSSAEPSSERKPPSAPTSSISSPSNTNLRSRSTAVSKTRPQAGNTTSSAPLGWRLKASGCSASGTTRCWPTPKACWKAPFRNSKGRGHPPLAPPIEGEPNCGLPTSKGAELPMYPYLCAERASTAVSHPHVIARNPVTAVGVTAALHPFSRCWRIHFRIPPNAALIAHDQPPEKCCKGMPANRFPGSETPSS